MTEKRIAIIIQNGRVKEIISDSAFITVDVYDLDCINAGYDPEFNFHVSGCSQEGYIKRLKEVENDIEIILTHTS